MTEIRPMKVGDGVVYVEIEETDISLAGNDGSDRPAPSSYEDDIEDSHVVGVTDDMYEAVASLKDSINALTSDVAGALEKAAPAEWSLEFSIGFKGKASPIPVLVSGEGNASLKVTATWRRE